MVWVDVPLGDCEEAGEAGLRREEVVVAGIQRAVPNPEPDREEFAGRIEQEAEVRLPEELLGLVGDRPQPSDERGRGRRSVAGFAARRFGQLRDRRVSGRPRRGLEQLEVSNVAAHGSPHRLRPGHELAVRTLSALRGEGCGNVGQRPGVPR